MANYGVLYVFRFESANKTNIEIQILKKNYSGARTYRSLGRAPILKREKSGCIHGSSLELYAECQVDGEFASLYTSSADEYKVEVYKIDEFLGDTFQRRVWTGFVSPELYSEPDIAPPYDVQIIATDGLGELKNYVFEARGLHSVQDHLEYMLGHTGLSQEFNVVSFMAGDSGTVPIMDVTVSLDHMAGESCYDVLKAVLDSFHAEIACQDGYWMIWRETDLVNLTSQVEVAEFGSQTKADWWPVGQLSTVIEPAKKRVTVISEDAYKDNVLKDVPFHADGATYDSEEKAFILPTAGTSVLKTLRFGAEVGYKLSLTVTARNVGSGDEGQPIGIKVKIGGRSYIVGDTFWLREKTDGKTSWTNTEGVIEKMLEAPSASDSAKDAQTIALELPLYSYSNRSYHYATSVEVTIFNTDGEYPIHVYDVTLSKLDQVKGYKSVLEIDNGAREEADEANLIIADDDRIPVAADIFMNGIALNASGEPISSWASGRLAAMGYMAFMSRDYALSVALPRMKVQGVLNVPESTLITPVLFSRFNTYYFPETYDYDLLNDELSVSLVSIPTAQIEVVSEEVTEVVDPFQSRPGGSAGGGSSSGGSSGGGEGSGEDSLIFEFTYDKITNKATAEMVSALAEAIAANKLILCNGRTYKFILEQDGRYGLVSDAYMDITAGKLKASVLAVMASSYDVQLMEEEVPVGNGGGAEVRTLFVNEALTSDELSYNAETVQLIFAQHPMIFFASAEEGTPLSEYELMGMDNGRMVFAKYELNEYSTGATYIYLAMDGSTEVGGFSNSELDGDKYDKYLDADSTNAVQNKVVTENIRALEAAMPLMAVIDLDTIIAQDTPIDNATRNALLELGGYTTGDKYFSKGWLWSRGYLYTIKVIPTDAGVQIHILSLKGWCEILEDNSKVNHLPSQGGGSIEVDAELSETSENAVSNKAVTMALAETEEVTAAALNELNKRFDYYATKEDIDATLAEMDEEINHIEGVLEATIIEDEEVTAAALNDLDKRVTSLEQNGGGGGGGGGDIYNVSFTIDPSTMELVMAYDVQPTFDFTLDENGNLIAII